MVTMLCPPTVRRIQGDRAVELYFTVSVESAENGQMIGEMLYTGIRDQLQQQGAWILHERLFAAPDQFAAILDTRAHLLGDLDDGVEPTCLIMPCAGVGDHAAVQVHAVVADARPEPIFANQPGSHASGRRLRLGQDQWFHGQTSTGLPGIPPEQQTDQALHDVAGILQQVGGQMRSVARTWYWLHDILDWYPAFNQTRNRFFRDQGLIRPDGRTVHLPASTGIGVSNPAGGAVTLEFIALPGQEDQLELIEAGGHQNSAFRYGSAFSRACLAPSPAGRTLYISGTAAIDPAGRTEHVGRIEPQIHATFEHVRALLGHYGCTDDDVLTSLAYSSNLDVLATFHQRHPVRPWPMISMLGQVCRPDLLFEVEVTAHVP